MRSLILLFSISIGSVAIAQPASTPASPLLAPDWSRVSALSIGTSVIVKAHNQSEGCKVAHVDASSFSCVRGSQTVAYDAPDVRSVRIPHRLRSTLVAAVIGVGTGAVIGYAAAGSSNCKSGSFCLNIVSRGDVAAAGAAVGGIVALPIGYFTDFTRSTIYKSR